MLLQNKSATEASIFAAWKIAFNENLLICLFRWNIHFKNIPTCWYSPLQYTSITRLLDSSPKAGFTLMLRGSQQGVRCIPVQRFRRKSDQNFCKNSHLKLSQRHTGSFSNASRGCPGAVWTSSIESQSQSTDMPIGCRETLIQSATV